MNRWGEPVLCDCGCRQMMAMEYPDRYVVKARHHGREHLVVLIKHTWGPAGGEYRTMLAQMAELSTN